MAVIKNATHKTIGRAIAQAKEFAKAGPRVAAVLACDGRFGAVAGFVSVDDERIKQVALVTPDGRVWRPSESDSDRTKHRSALRCELTMSKSRAVLMTRDELCHLLYVVGLEQGRRLARIASSECGEEERQNLRHDFNYMGGVVHRLSNARAISIVDTEPPARDEAGSILHNEDSGMPR